MAGGAARGIDRRVDHPPAIAEPFDRAVRRRQHARASMVAGAFDFLTHAIAADLAARVAAFDRRFAVVVDSGGSGIAASELTITLDASPEVAARLAAGPQASPFTASVAADEDRLPFADASVDLIASVARLHGVNDLPGALILARRALRPGGVFVAGFAGGATLAEVRADLLAAESELTGRAAPRIAPMVDTDAAAGLLQRAGFAGPVVEVDTLSVRYDDLFAVLRDLRGMGEGNIMRSRVPLRRDVLADAARRFAMRADAGGRIAVTVQVIYLTGWAR